MSYIGNQPITAAFLVDTFSGTGSQTAFTMTVAPANTSSIIVAVTGVLQDPSTYSVSGTTLTFSAAPPSGTSNISVRYLGIPASGVTTTAYRTVTNTTATAGQTSFTIPSYTVGYVDVYRNGVYLPTSDYTASTGTTVVLNNGATAGDTITTVSFYVSSVLNAIPNSPASVGSSNIVSGVTLTNPVIVGSAPQTTIYTSGSGTYTTPANCRYLQIKMVGGGGGGGGGNWQGSSSGAGGTGGTTTFGSASATGGSGGTNSSVSAYGGAGGSATIGPISGIAVNGNYGQPGMNQITTVSIAYSLAGNGAASPFSGGGGASANSSGGQAGGYGAGGGGASNTTNSATGSGGGAGGYIEGLITSPSASYAYSVGAGGTGGPNNGASGGTGGAGGSGVIIVTAYF